MRFDRPEPPAPAHNTWQDLAQPVLTRLSFDWVREEDAFHGLNIPNTRWFALDRLDVTERRKRWFRDGWWLRLKMHA